MTRPPDFDALYRRSPDPFAVGSSWYEQRKIALALASLARPRYDHTWDTAAGTGHLAAGLASRSRYVLATDASSVAVAALSTPEARAGLPGNVTVAQSALPHLPQQARGADLVLVSEVLYYLPDHERAAAVTMLAGLDAEIVAVQWRYHPDDAFLSGADATGELDLALPAAGFIRAVAHEDTNFVLTTYLPTSRDAS